MTAEEIFAWLWSLEGLEWSKVNQRRVGHSSGWLADIKNDHECSEANGCSFGYEPSSDIHIKRDLLKYGLSGVPKEWLERVEC